MKPSDLLKIVVLTVLLLGVEAVNKAYINAYYPPRSIIPFSVLVYKWFFVFLTTVFALFFSGKMISQTENDQSFIIGFISLGLLVILEMTSHAVCGGTVFILFLNIIPIAIGATLGASLSR